LVLIACSKDANDSKNYIEEESIQSQLKFIEKDIDALNNLTQSYSATSSDELVPQITIIIVHWDWGRPSKRCKGFGFCRVEWFPYIGTVELAALQNDEYSGWSTLEYDEVDSNYYLELLLAEPLPSNLLADSISLYIDNDMFLPIQDINTFANSLLQNYSNFIVDEGKYDFLPDLGNYGGYKIIFRKE
jgi:hypothetical protein